MNSETPLRAENLRIHNKNLVLSLIYQQQAAGISQSIIVDQTGLKAPTIFRIFNELQADEVIEPVAVSADESPAAKKGRRPVNFRVRRTARYSIAVEFWTAYISIGVFDFWGERIQSIIQNLKPDMTADGITEIITSSIRSIIWTLDIPIEKIMGVGVAAPGQVDLSKKVITYYPRIKGMQDYPVVTKLQQSLQIPVILHNNCSALAVGEFRYGKFDTGGSLFTFLLRSGVNGSFINNDMVYLNSRHQTIEAGHIPILMDGPACTCGKKGCLEACLKSLDRNSPDTAMMFSSLNAGSPEFPVIMNKAAGYLAAAVNMIAQILSPSAYLIVACNDGVASALAGYLQNRIQKDCFTTRLPVVYHAGYDPLFTQRGISDQVIANYFFEETI